MSASDLDGRSSRLSESSSNDWPLRIAMLFIFIAIIAAVVVVGFKYYGLPLNAAVQSPPPQTAAVVPTQTTSPPQVKTPAAADDPTAMFREFQAYQRGLKEGAQR